MITLSKSSPPSFVSPDVDLTYKDGEEAIDIPINLNFFWPDL